MVKWGKLPDLHTMNAIVAHWDIAYAGTDTSDFNACKIWGRHKMILADRRIRKAVKDETLRTMDVHEAG